MKQMTSATATGYETFRKTTRRRVGLEWRLRTSFLQQWFNLSDPAVEDALYDSTAMRAFVGIELGLDPSQTETTVCRFRHVLETHGLGAPLFDAVNRDLHTRGVRVATGTIADATIISAPLPPATGEHPKPSIFPRCVVHSC